MTEYIVKKKIDLFEFIKCHKEDYGWEQMGQSCPSFRQDVSRWGSHSLMTWNFGIGEKFTNRACQEMSKEFIPHLLKYGFIEEVKKEETYKEGDIFILGSQHYMLTSVDFNTMILVGLGAGRGNRFVGPERVGSHKRVSQAELDRMSGTQASKFKKVEDAIIEVLTPCKG